jgi:hypothetical protein
MIIKLTHALLDKKECKRLSNEVRCLLLQCLNDQITVLDWKTLTKLSREDYSLLFQQALVNCPNINSAMINSTIWEVSALLPRLDPEDLLASIGVAWRNLRFLELDDVTYGDKVKKSCRTSLLKAVCDNVPRLRYFINF